MFGKDSDIPIAWIEGGRTFLSIEICQDKYERPAPANSRFIIAGGGNLWEPPFNGPELKRGTQRGHVCGALLRWSNFQDFQVVWHDPTNDCAVAGWVWSPIRELFSERRGTYCDDREGKYHYQAKHWP